MKRMILALLLVGLFLLPISSAQAYIVDLSGIITADSGYFGFGDDPSWNISTVEGSGGVFTMAGLTINLYDKTITSTNPLIYGPPNYTASIVGNIINFGFDISQDNIRYILDLSGNGGPTDFAVTGSLNVVPAPAPVLLLASGLLGLVGIRRKIRKG